MIRNLEERPLSGKKIFQISCNNCSIFVCRAVALCGRLAADLGAEVVCVMCNGGGDPLAASAFLAAGKRFHAGALADVGREVAASDAVVSCCDDGVPAGPAHVRIRLWSEGVEERPASAFTLMASAGLLDMVGDADREPLRLAGLQLDYSAGLSAYTAMAAMLVGGGGGRAEVSLLDVATWLNWKSLVVAHQGGAPPSRKGRDAEWQVLRCSDGWIALVYRENDWDAVKRLIANPLLDDPELDIRANRRRRATFIADLAEARFLTMSRRNIVAFAKANRIPLGPVLSPCEITADPQYTSRQVFHTVEAADGPVVIPRLPVRWGERIFAPGPVEAAAGSAGAP